MHGSFLSQPELRIRVKFYFSISILEILHALLLHGTTLITSKNGCTGEQFLVSERTGLLLNVKHHVYCKILQCLRKKKIKRVFMISDESKDNKFLSAVNEERQTYLQRIKELENMVCEFLIVSDIND